MTPDLSHLHHPILEMEGVEVYARVEDPVVARTFFGVVKAEEVPGCGLLYMTILVSHDLRDLHEKIRDWAYRVQKGVPGFRYGALVFLNGIMTNQCTTVHQTYEDAEEALKSGLEAMVPGWQGMEHEWVKKAQTEPREV